MGFWENVVKGLQERKGEFTGLDEKQLGKVITQTNQGKATLVQKPTSYRTNKDDGTQDIGLTSGEAIPVESSAVQSIEYDPENEVATVVFNGGTKGYQYKATPEEYKEFLTAPSKGQKINYDWKFNNRMPGY